MKSPIALLSSLLDDFSRLNPDVKGLDRDIITIKSRFEHEGYGFLTVALSALDTSLLQGLSSGRFTCPSHFKPVKGGTIPRFLSGMFCKVFDPFSGILKDDVDFGVLKSIRELLRLFKKVQMPDHDVDKLHEKAVSEFFRCDDEAKRFIIPDRISHLIRRVSPYILRTLSSKSPQNGIYKHGPGAVYEGYSANQKWSALSDSIRNVEFDLEGYGYDTHEVSLNDLSFRNMSTLSNPQVFLKTEASSSIARLISVDKDISSRRTITVEPMLNQFIQQGLNGILRQAISECPILRQSLALTDQSLNQKLAIEGSLFDNWATIDLKSASDLLSVKLVETVFGHHSLFLDYMMDCRSPKVESNGVAYEIGKFAGMGNALTFPVQSICFAVTCIAAILDKWGKTPTYWNVLRAARHIRVYGDDIIVSTEYAHQCVNWLHLVGLKVNEKKSFLVGNFKESCGVDAFRGVDITPLYCRHRPDQSEVSPKLIENFVSLSNQAWLRGLYKFSDRIKEHVEDLLRKRLPLVSSKSGVLGWHTRLEAMTPHKWSRSMQQLCTRSIASVPLKRKDRLDGWPALLKFFHLSREGDRLDYLVGLLTSKDHLSESEIRHKTKLTPRWVPTRTA